jgi:hypothetical protein
MCVCVCVCVCVLEYKQYKQYIIWECGQYVDDLKSIINIRFYANFSTFSQFKHLRFPQFLNRPVCLYTQAS